MYLHIQIKALFYNKSVAIEDFSDHGTFIRWYAQHMLRTCDGNHALKKMISNLKKAAGDGDNFLKIPLRVCTVIYATISYKEHDSPLLAEYLGTEKPFVRMSKCIRRNRKKDKLSIGVMQSTFRQST